MNATALALTGFIGWFILLLLSLGGVRILATLKGKAPNSFRPDGTDVSDFAVRLVRAHANCYESFPFVGGLMLLAMATQTTEITNPLALIVLTARIGQSSIHLVSTSNLAVQARFSLFLVQVVISLYWLTAFWQRFAG
jgi:uncharacterized MAPEG superfamily protein